MNDSDHVVEEEPPKAIEGEYKYMEIEFSDTITKARETKDLSEKIVKEVERILKETYWPNELKYVGGLFKTLHWTIGAHIKLLLKLSVPPFSNKTWDRFLAVIFPFFGFLLILVQMQANSLYLWEGSFILAIFLSALVWRTTAASQPPQYLLLLMFLGFAQSIQWIWLLCNISVEIFKLFIEIFQLQPAYVGITFMAAANSVGDIVSDIAMARLGYPVMALTAAFAGPIFNIMMGVGVTMTRNVIKSGTSLDFSFHELFDLSNENMLIFVTLLTNILTLASILAILMHNKFVMTKKTAMWSAGMYGAFFVLLSILTANMKHKAY